MPLSPSVAPAPRAILATAARYTHTQTHSWTLLKDHVQTLSLYIVYRPIHVSNFFTFPCLPRHLSTGADAHLPAKMEDAVAKRMLPSSVNVLMAGLDVTVTSLGSPVRQLLAREVFLRPGNFELQCMMTFDRL